MDRLTARSQDGRAYINDSEYGLIEDELWKAVDVLADMEDILESGELVRVVRCKDCKNSEPDARLNTYPYYCYMHAVLTKETDFCSYGERRETI